jgi:prephenate dehydrogenase
VLLSYLSALKSMKGLKRAEGLQTPMFASLLELAKAVLAGNPDLYGEVQVQNKYAQVTRSVLMEACRSLDIAFAARDVKTPRKIFEEALALWGQGDVQAAYKRLYEYFEREEKI